MQRLLNQALASRSHLDTAATQRVQSTQSCNAEVHLARKLRHLRLTARISTSSAAISIRERPQHDAKSYHGEHSDGEVLPSLEEKRPAGQGLHEAGSDSPVPALKRP